MTKFIVYILSILSIGSFSFYLGTLSKGEKSANMSNNETNPTSIRGLSGYTFINPLLECEVNTYGSNQKYIPFEQEVLSKIEKDIQKKSPDIHLSVYFRNLNNGPWFGINENENFSPASLMKLPILFMYLKWAESEPNLLSKMVHIDAPSETAQIFQPAKRLEIGKDYTVGEVLTYLIVYSDNTGVLPLLSQIPESLQEQVLQDLGVPSIKETIKAKNEYILSVKEYASFFRLLYNASYLGKGSSEEALKLLSLSAFDEGIRANIPKKVPIAHKFGEREMLGGSGEVIHQLHDCGVIYYPRYPYLLCVMTKGPTEYQNLSKIIQGTSDIIYSEIEKAYPIQ